MQRELTGRLTLAKILLLYLVLLLAAGGRLVAQQQKPTCLLVMNRTGFVVEVFAVTPSGLQSRGRVNPDTDMSVHNVSNGDEFRAVWREKSDSWRVQLVFDRQYGGWIDRWTVSQPK